MSELDRYLATMTVDNVWPAANSPADAAKVITDLVDPDADVLVWFSSGYHPMDDMLAAWVTLNLITEAQARATSAARAAETAAFLAAYRANPPEMTDEALFEARAAFGPGTKIVNVITGQQTQL
jgi:hypothetical protein